MPPCVFMPVMGTGEEPQARGWAFWTAGSEITDAAQGSVGRRKPSPVPGAPGVAQHHSTVEAGELASEGPGGGEGCCQRMELAGGTRGSTLRFRTLSPLPRRIASGVYACLHWGCYRRTANPSADEPCASKTQARICGSPGRVTARGSILRILAPFFSYSGTQVGSVWASQVEGCSVQPQAGAVELPHHFEADRTGEPVAREDIGERGQWLFCTLLTELCGRRHRFFRPRFLGDKFPTFDYVVEVVESPCLFLLRPGEGYDARLHRGGAPLARSGCAGRH